MWATTAGNPTEVSVTAQPTDDKAQPVETRYSQKTLVRIKHARTARDLILFVGGIVFTVLWFAVPVASYTINDPIWIFTIAITVVFGIAALMHGVMDPAWNRTWSRQMRYTLSIVFIVGGIYVMLLSLDQSGYIGVQGSGQTTNCRFVSSRGVSRTTGHYSYDCDLDVHWSDGTTTHEDLEATTPVNDGQTVKYVKPGSAATQGLFPAGTRPAAAWTQVWFYLLAGLVVFLQSAFALGVLIFGRRPRIA